MRTQFGNEHYSNNFRKQIRQKQHKINKIVKQGNKALVEDNLWKGRFWCRQIDRHAGVWSDGSGTYISVLIRMYDKKTKKYFDYWWRVHWISVYWQYSMEVLNDAITERFDVWRNERPREDKEDYTSKKYNYDISEYEPLNEGWWNTRYVG